MSNIISNVKKIRDGLDITTKDETVSTVNRKTGNWEPHTISAITGYCSQAKAIYLARKLMDLAKSSGKPLVKR